MQQCSQNLAEHTLPLFYCGNIFVLFIVLYCIMIATVSHLIHPVASTASHTTHHATWLWSQAACLYSSIISHSTSPLMSIHFTYRWPCHAVYSRIAMLTAHDIAFCIYSLYLPYKKQAVVSLSTPSLKASLWKSWQVSSSPTHSPCTSYSSCCASQFTLCSFFVLLE